MTDTQSLTSQPVPLNGRAVTAILKLLEGHSLMTLATNGPDGQPHVSTLGYANDGLNLYFVTASNSEKCANLMVDDRVGVAIRGRAEEGEAIGISIKGRALRLESPQDLEALYARILDGSPDQMPFAPGQNDAVAFKLVPHVIKAVAVIEGQSRAKTFTIGDPEAATQGEAYVPSAVARLF